MNKKELAEQYFELSNMRITLGQMVDMSSMRVAEEEVYQAIKDSVEEVYTEEELKAYITLFGSEAGKSATLKVGYFQRVMENNLRKLIINKEEIQNESK